MAGISGTCFYCDEPVGKYVSGDGHRTVDHLVAKCWMLEMDRARLTEKWRTLNKVICCEGCNNYKGKIKALDWLVIMPTPGADRTRRRLLQLGCSQAAVDAAMARRPDAGA